MDVPRIPDRSLRAARDEGAEIRLEALPMAALFVAADGTALAVNQRWTELSGLSAASSRLRGWLEPLEDGAWATALDIVRQSFLGGNTGGQDLLLTGPAGRRWTRWWSGADEATSDAAVVLIADVHDDVADLVHLPRAARTQPARQYSSGSLRSMRDHPSTR